MSIIPSLLEPRVILTSEVLDHLRLAFHQCGLSINDVYVRVRGGAWRAFPLDLEPSSVTDDRFCSYIQEQGPFGQTCTSDHLDFCDAVMLHPGVPLVRTCPFGLDVLGIGFGILSTQIVLRTTPWREWGNESLATNATVELIERHQVSSIRDQALLFLNEQPARRLPEVTSHFELLRALIGLVQVQAHAEFERKLAKAKAHLLQDLRLLTTPLLARLEDDQRYLSLMSAVSVVADFFQLDYCEFLYGNIDDGNQITSIRPAQERAILLDDGRLQRLLFGHLTSAVGKSEIVTLDDFAEPPTARVVCRITLPVGNAVALLIAPVPSDDSPLDSNSLSDLTHTLSIPIFVGALQADLHRESDLRLLQARNAQHSIRSVFQGVVGDVEDIRRAVGSISAGARQQLAEPLAHMEELVDFVGALLHSLDYVDALHSRKDRRRIVLRQARRVRLYEILQRTRDGFRSRSSQLHTEIILDPSLERLPPVLVDEGAISVLFINLFHNALKYSHSSSGRRNRNIDVRAREDPVSVYIEVVDFGIGIHPTETEKIFEPFVQGSVEHPTNSIGGQGLGLAAARQIARLHDGDLTLKRCVCYSDDGAEITTSAILAHKAGSSEASRLLERCLVIFEVSLPKPGLEGRHE
jgi:signal transduction histidine kinase